MSKWNARTYDTFAGLIADDSVDQASAEFLADALAETFAEDNARFDEGRWYAACHVIPPDHRRDLDAQIALGDDDPSALESMACDR